MNKIIMIKICTLVLSVAMLLISIVGCADKATDTTSSNRRPDTSSSDNMTSDDTSSEEGDTITTLVEVEYDAEKNPLKRGVNLSNYEMHEEIGYENWIFQSKYYDALREKGFDHVRLPVDFFDYIDFEDPNYAIDEEILRQLDMIINNALSAGLKIVLDFHHFGVLQKQFNTHKDKYFKIWEQLSVHYQNYPSGLVFELINEPGNPGTVKNAPDPITPHITQIQEEAIKIIRKTNPTRLIVHATKYNNHYDALKSTPAPEDENVIMSVHVYDPYDFTHQGTTWMDSAYENTRPYGEDVRADLESIFQGLAEYQQSTGVPVWLGEFGVTNKASAEDRYKYAELVNELAQKYKIGWCWFEFSSGFGLYDLANGDWTADGVADALTK